MASEFLSLSAVVEHLAGLEINYETLLKAMRQTVIAETKKGFRDEQDPDGNQWKKLKHPRRNSRGSDRVLQDYGTMRTSVTAINASGGIDEIGPTYLEWGTNIPYAVYHNSDKPRKKNADGTDRLPRRQFLGVGQDLANAVTEQVADFVEAEIARIFE